MALTVAQKTKILRYLGFPAKTLDDTSMSYSKITADRMLNLTAETEADVADLMSRIEQLDQQRTKQLKRAGVKSIDDIELDSEVALRELKKERLRLLNELACLLDMPNMTAGSRQGFVIS